MNRLWCFLLGIKRLKKIKYRIFRDWVWPANLNEFSSRNLIYGWNGAGKTTLSRIFRLIEKKDLVDEGEWEIELSNDTILTHSNERNEEVKIKVFNQDFIQENVFTINRDITPIYYIGEENIEKRKNIEGLKNDLTQKKQALSKSQGEENSLKREFDQFCSDIANRSIKELLSSSPSNSYNNYDRSRYIRKSEELQSIDDIQKLILTQDEEDSLNKKKSTTPKQKIAAIHINLPHGEEIKARLESLFSTTVISQVIQSLEGKKQLSDWIKTGLDIFKAEQVNHCLFCEQRLPEDRLKALEGHFNNEYNIFMQRLSDEDLKISETITHLRNFHLPDESRLYDHLQSEYLRAKNLLTDQINNLIKYLESLIQLISSKKEKPFESIQSNINLDLEAQEDLLKELDKIILKHNTETDDFTKITQDSREKLESHIVAKALPDYKEKNALYKKAQDQVNQLKGEIKTINDNIIKLEKDILEHRKPAEELNADLSSYLGSDSLRFELSESGYQIMRGGKVASNLSEGEKTAIAFLYFLKSLEDKAFQIESGIVVIDDPVSSLDSSALYHAYAFMQKKTENAWQLFILTHNHAFFRQVRNWFCYLKKNQRQFYILEAFEDSEGRKSYIKTLDKLLLDFDSDYHYLFNKVYTTANSLASDSMEAYYHLPNMARRLLEAFLAFRFPSNNKEIYHKLQMVDFDVSKKARIGDFLNIHSHNKTIHEPEHDQSILTETPSILKDILELIKFEDPKHYKEMLETVPFVDSAIKSIKQLSIH